MNAARGKPISLKVSLSGRASGSTVGSRKLGLRGFLSGEGVETEQEDNVSKIDILTEESVRMRYTLLGTLPNGAWIKRCRRELCSC